MNTASKIVADFPSETETRKSVASWYTPGLSDALGDRLLMFDNTSGSSLELLRFKREFASRPLFEDALRRSVAHLERLEHPSLARIRAIEFLDGDDGLALVSNQVIGRRLTELLGEARGQKFAIEFLRQLVPALADLQSRGLSVAHGLISPDRIVVTPEGSLVLVEHVLGAAVESLNLPPDRLRRDFGLPIPIDAGRRRSSGFGVQLDQRADVLQLGFVALSLLAGRHLRSTEYPKSSALLEELAESPNGSRPSPRLLDWLQRALQFHDRAFSSAEEAHEALAEIPAEQLQHLESPRRRFDVPALPAALEAPVLDEDSADAGGTSDDLAEYLRAYSPAPVPPPAPPAPRLAAVEVRSFPEIALSPIGAPAAIQHAAETSPPVLSDFAVEAESRPIPEIPPGAATRNVVRWVIGALSIAVLAEALVIAGMVYTRRTSGARATTSVPAQQTAASTPDSPTPAKPESAVAAATAAASVATGTGRLEISSEPSGARVSVDGTRRGVTPLVLQVSPGVHTVVVTDGNTTSTRTVNVAAGGAVTFMASLPGGTPAGWLSINSPVELQVREGASLIGITSADRLMLPAGHHDLTLSGQAFGFQTTLSVDIQPGRTASANVRVPNGSVSINALPWANVWLDGQALGTTPLANLDVPLGSHEVTWRHPQFGERKQTITVTARTPVRVVMDLSK